MAFVATEARSVSTDRTESAAGWNSFIAKSTNSIRIHTDEIVEDAKQHFFSCADHLVIHPYGKLRLVWDRAMVLLMWYNVFAVPVQIAFEPSIEATPWVSLALFYSDIVVDVYFIIDLQLNFFTGYYTSAEYHLTRDESCLVMEFPRIASRYLRGWFLVDLLSLGVPFGLGAGATAVDKAMSLLKILRILRLLGRSRSTSTVRRAGFLGSPQFKSVLNLLWMYILGAHYCGCSFFFIGRALSGQANGNWLGDGGPDDLRGRPLHEQYLTCIYFGMMTLTTVGYGDISPQSHTERNFVTLLLFLGALLDALVFGTVLNLISARDSGQQRYTRKVDEIMEVCHNLRLPHALQQRMLAQLDSAWDAHQGVDVGAVLSIFPPLMQTDIQMKIHHEVVRQVPFFRKCPEAFIRAVVMLLQREVVAAGSYVFLRGDHARSMFFLRKGMLEESRSGSRRPASYAPGSFFGETSLLLEGRRSASVRAVTRAELYTLSSGSMGTVFLNFPEVKDKLRSVAIRRLERRLGKTRRRRASEVSASIRELRSQQAESEQQRQEEELSHRQLLALTSSKERDRAVEEREREKSARGGGGGSGGGSPRRRVVDSDDESVSDEEERLGGEEGARGEAAAVAASSGGSGSTPVASALPVALAASIGGGDSSGGAVTASGGAGMVASTRRGSGGATFVAPGTSLAAATAATVGHAPPAATAMLVGDNGGGGGGGSGGNPMGLSDKQMEALTARIRSIAKNDAELRTLGFDRMAKLQASVQQLRERVALRRARQQAQVPPQEQQDQPTLTAHTVATTTTATTA